MAGLHNATEGPHKQVAYRSCALSRRISDTCIVGIGLSTVSSGIYYAPSYAPPFYPHRQTIPESRLGIENFPSVSASRIDAGILTGHWKDRFLECFEVSLLFDGDLPSDVFHSHTFTETKALCETLRLSEDGVIAEYLNLLWSDFHAIFRGSKYNFKYELVIAVPGIWPFYAPQFLLYAIEGADILSDKVNLMPKFIPNIEAASIALILDMSTQQGRVPPILKSRDTVIVCDCGNFITESIAYKISSVELLDMKQITRGGSVFAGPALMDNAFVSLLREKIEKSCPDFATHFTGQRLREFARYHWEMNMKTNFCGERRELTFPVPDLNGCDTEQTISFSAFELGLVFDPVVDKIANLVRSQVESILNHVDCVNVAELHVVIAGGFGHSPYVQTRIKQAVLELVPSAAFHCPPGDQGCTAAARGAVHRGLQLFWRNSRGYDGHDWSYVTSRVVHASYGIYSYLRREIIWLVSEDSELSAVDQNRRRLPSEAILTNIVGNLDTIIEIYCKSKEDLQEKFFCTVHLPSAGSKTGIDLDFKWDGFQMEVSVLRRGRELKGARVTYRILRPNFESVRG